jgi:hypothetical protein
VQKSICRAQDFTRAQSYAMLDKKYEEGFDRRILKKKKGSRAFAIEKI